jgi:hypothetical protein
MEQLYGQATTMNYPQMNVLNGQQNLNFSKNLVAMQGLPTSS